MEKDYGLFLLSCLVTFTLVCSEVKHGVLQTTVKPARANIRNTKMVTKVAEEVQRPARSLGRVEMEDFSQWTQSSCKSVMYLIRAKSKIISRLRSDMKKDKPSLPDSLRKAVHVFESELNDTENALYDSLNDLKFLLQHDYTSVESIKQVVGKRLESLKSVTWKEENDYKEISTIVDEIHALKAKENRTADTSIVGEKVKSLIEEVLSEISFAADKLEAELGDDLFEKSKKSKGASIEAVIRIGEHTKSDGNEDESKDSPDSHAEESDDGEMSILVDSQSNQFVLSKGKDATIPHEDRNFVQDIINIIVLSFLCGTVCSMFHFPSMFGYVLTGMILGPVGVNSIKSVVQVETLGEFGVFFILFTLGLEFSPDRIRKVWKVAVAGSTLMMVIMIMTGAVWGTCFGILMQQSVFVAACLSLSSTPLVSKYVEKKGSDGKEHSNGDEDYTSSLLGILVMQDVHLGFLIAILPALAGRHTSENGMSNNGVIHDVFHGTAHGNSTAHDNYSSFVSTAWIFLELFGAVILLIAICLVISTFVIGKFFRFVQSFKSIELLTLGTVTVAFSVLMLTEHLGISMELGCFVAGVVISTMGEKHVGEVMVLIEPVRDVFSCLFFASIGLHVFPSFVLKEFPVVMTLTFGVVAIKFGVGVFVLRLLIKHDKNTKYIVAAGLAQVSEFSFVLGSRARRFHLISREVYLIILSVTSLSLLFSPVLWRVSLWRYAGKKPFSSRISSHVKPV